MLRGNAVETCAALRFLSTLSPGLLINSMLQNSRVAAEDKRDGFLPVNKGDVGH